MRRPEPLPVFLGPWRRSPGRATVNRKTGRTEAAGVGGDPGRSTAGAVPPRPAAGALPDHATRRDVPCALAHHLTRSRGLRAAGGRRGQGMSEVFEASGRAAYGREKDVGWARRPGGNVEPPKVPATAVDLGRVLGRAPRCRGAWAVRRWRPGWVDESPQVAVSLAVDVGAGGCR